MATMNMLQAINNALQSPWQKMRKLSALVKTWVFLAVYSVPPATCRRSTAKRAALIPPLVEQGIIGFANGLAAPGSVPVS